MEEEGGGYRVVTWRPNVCSTFIFSSPPLSRRLHFPTHHSLVSRLLSPLRTRTAPFRVRILSHSSSGAGERSLGVDSDGVAQDADYQLQLGCVVRLRQHGIPAAAPRLSRGQLPSFAAVMGLETCSARGSMAQRDTQCAS